MGWEASYVQNDHSEFLGKFGKWADKNIGGFHKDLTKGTVGLLVAPINSVTGHRYKPTYSTKVGGAISGTANMGVDSVHLVGKTFANAATGNYASKVTDVFRSKENKEAGGHYHELEKTPGLEGRTLGTLQGISKGGAMIIGSMYGSAATGSGSSSNSKPPAGASPDLTEPAPVPSNTIADALPPYGSEASAGAQTPDPVESAPSGIVERFSVFN